MLQSRFTRWTEIKIITNGAFISNTHYSFLPAPITSDFFMYDHVFSTFFLVYKYLLQNRLTLNFTFYLKSWHLFALLQNLLFNFRYNFRHHFLYFILNNRVLKLWIFKNLIFRLDYFDLWYLFFNKSDLFDFLNACFYLALINSLNKFLMIFFDIDLHYFKSRVEQNLIITTILHCNLITIIIEVGE